MPDRRFIKKPDLTELRQLLFGLVTSCPFDQSNPSDCLLYEIRLLPLKERFDWIHSLTMEEAEAIWTHHEKNLEKKETLRLCDKCKTRSK